ncbi:NADH-quinone oxidoreductase subunit NuoE [Methylocaldum szegediense]|uniref:NADH-quinone oxidoreductase subunit E n=1 Tax=Methylocaldum szegediense TaxID=73780 RepID=A0ABN8X7R0_9GAMM|nr:NADH-quinone oxidoreductase subunit NuoE [Methylocaldum szegediense]CAI8847704.1 NADH:quinone oxidoreductase subunit E [Methylocaldum szegediense]
MNETGILSEHETAEILAAAEHYPDKSAASIEALKIVQKHRGWVPDDALKSVAGLLEMSPDELDSVATFYNLIFRKPVGKNVVLCCDSVSCWILGADRIRERLSERLGIGLGETTADGRYTLLPIVCLGACDRAPVLMVGEELWENMDESKIDELLKRHGEAWTNR